MNSNRFLISIVIGMIALMADSAFAAPAFPGAEGYGANATGGRGGRVIKVTNLSDSGAGSFRAAVTASGPRIVVFEVSGIINLNSPIEIRNGDLTIAGQTSPGGVMVTGHTTRTRASNIIIRHMRFRVGSHRISDGADPETLDSFNVWGPDSATSNHSDIIIDHCSFGWGVDENLSTAYNVQNITISNNIVAEGLSNAGHPKGEHSKGLFIQGKHTPNLRITLHHNYIAHNTDRNPLISSVDESDIVVDVVNNVSYNFKGGLSPATTGNGVRVNWTHNYTKGGPQSRNGSYYEVQHQNGTAAPKIYAMGNIGGTRLTQGGSEWTVGRFYYDELLDEAWRVMTPWPSGPLPVTTTTMSFEYAQEVVQNAGATKPFRDSVDSRVVNDFAAGTGSIRNNVQFPEDFPTYQNLQAPADNDDDGMADSWEQNNGFNTSVDDSAGDADGDGYTNIEEYLNFLAEDAEVVRPMAPANLEATES